MQNNATKRFSTPVLPSHAAVHIGRDSGDSSSDNNVPTPTVLQRRHTTGEINTSLPPLKNYIPEAILAECSMYKPQDESDELHNVNTSNMDPEKALIIKKQRKQKKMNREKLKRSKLNLLFDHLCSVLAMGNNTRVEKLSVLNETIREVKQLRAQNEQLRQQRELIKGELVKRNGGLFTTTVPTRPVTAANGIRNHGTVPPCNTPAQSSRTLSSMQLTTTKSAIATSHTVPAPDTKTVTATTTTAVKNEIRPCPATCPQPKRTLIANQTTNLTTPSCPRARSAPVAATPPAISRSVSGSAVDRRGSQTDVIGAGMFRLCVTEPSEHPAFTSPNTNTTASLPFFTSTLDTPGSRGRRFSRHQRMETFEAAGLGDDDDKDTGFPKMLFDDNDLLGLTDTNDATSSSAGTNLFLKTDDVSPRLNSLDTFSFGSPSRFGASPFGGTHKLRHSWGQLPTSKELDADFDMAFGGKATGSDLADPLPKDFGGLYNYRGEDETQLDSGLMDNIRHLVGADQVHNASLTPMDDIDMFLSAGDHGGHVAHSRDTSDLLCAF